MVEMSEEENVARLPIDRMHERHAGLTLQLAESYCQAAFVCLDRHHRPPVIFILSDGKKESNAELVWETTTPQIRGAWANTIDTTEAGAYACVLAGTELLCGYVAVRRAETGTGADYYVGPPGTGIDDLEDCLRLEISGVDIGNQTALKARLKTKIKQAQKGTSSLPALAGVVGFQARQIMFAEVTERT
jgi:hypothetical protein